MGPENDIVIGFITNYKYDHKVRNWVKSLIDVDFIGTKIMVCYNEDQIVLDKLKSLGFIVYNLSIVDFNIVNVRFFHIWQLLKDFSKTHLKLKPRYIITTDVADVVFQSNPSIWLEENMGDKKLCFGGEGLKYKDEAWGHQNMGLSFSNIEKEYMEDSPIYNAGTIAGEFDYLIDFCYNVSLTIFGRPQYVPGGGGPDQAALNLLLSLKPYRDISLLNDHDSGWACQCGTTVDPNKIDGFRPNLLCKEPVWDGEFMRNSKGEKFVLLHQYNRVPMIDQYMRKKYE